MIRFALLDLLGLIALVLVCFGGPAILQLIYGG